MPSPAHAEENGKTSSCHPSCQPPSSVRGTETRRHSAGWTQTLPSVTVLLVSPLPVQEGEFMRQNLCCSQGQQPSPFTRSATLSVSEGPGRRLDPGTERWHSRGHLPALAEQCPPGRGRSLTAPQGSRQVAPSARLPQRLHGSPRLETTDGAGRLWEIGSTLIIGMQEHKRSWKEQSATSSPSWQGAGGLSRQKPALFSASSELTKAVPGQGIGALGHWQRLCCNITLGVKES